MDVPTLFLFALQRLIGATQPFQHLLLCGGKFGDDDVQKKGGPVQQPFGRLDPFEDDALGH